MLGEATTRPRTDEDTDLGFQGHKTNQIGEQPEQHPNPDDWKQRQTGPERGPNQPSHGQNKRQKGNRENRK